GRAGHAAQAGPDLRRQSLHAARLRRAVRWQRDRPRDRARRARRPARAVARGEPDRRRGDDVRRRLGGHLRSGQGRARRDRRDPLLAGRDAAGTAAGRPPDRRRALLRPGRQPRGLVVDVPALRPSRALQARLAPAPLPRRLPHLAYADVRIEIIEAKSATAENGGGKSSSDDYAFGLGVRVLAGDRALAPGYLGLALGAADVEDLPRVIRDALERAYRRAL